MDIKQAHYSYLRTPFIVLIITVVALFVACGGGGGGTVTPPPPPPPPQSTDFSVTTSSSMVVLTPGASNDLTFKVQPINNFTGQVQISLSGLPSTITVSSASFSLNESSSKTVFFTAAANVDPGDYMITVTATSGAVTHNYSVAAKVPAGSLGDAPSRSTYLDVKYSTYNFINGFGYPGWRISLYDPVHKLFFMSVTFGSEIIAIDPKTEKIVAEIPLPQPFGMDFSRDYSKLYVATTSNYLYVIDTSKLQVSERIDTTTWGGVGYTMVQPLALADGKIGFLADLSQGTFIWNPADNSVEHVADGAWSVIRSQDGTKIAYSNGGNGIGIFDVNTHVLLTATPVFRDGVNLASAFQPFQNHFLVVGGPNGYTHAVLYDENLNVLQDYTPAVTNYGSDINYCNGVFSRDGSEIYLEDSVALSFAVLDANTFQVKGYVPRIDPSSNYLGLFSQDIDETGLAIGASHQGAVLTDTSTKRLTKTAVLGSLAYFTPASGPASGGTAAQANFFAGNNNDLNTSGAKVYFGAIPASNATATSTGTMSATSPPNMLGVVNVGTYFSDGNMTMGADAFSYGPSVYDFDITASTADGGRGILYGYGMNSGATVNIGGTAASGTAAIVGHVYSPGPSQKLTYAIPPGNVGLTDFSLQTEDGTRTYKNQFRYYPAVQKYNLTTASALWMGAYDQSRRLIYFTESAQVDVFDLTLRKWLDPIAIPSGARVRTLRYLAVSPNADYLAVTDSANQSLIAIDLSTRQFMREIQLSGTGSPDYFVAAPIVFASDSQVLAFAGGNLHLTDITSGVTLWSKQTIFPFGTIHAKMMLDASGRYLLFNSGYYFDLQEVSDPYPVLSTHLWGCRGVANSELSVSPDGKVSVGGCFLDKNLYVTSIAYWSDAQWWSVDPRYGQVWDPSGTFAFQPTAVGIDIVDFKTGAIRERISTGLTIPEATFSAVLDPETSQLYMLTDQGIASMDLSSLPLGLNSATPSSGTAGTTVEVVGRGFDSKSTLLVDGQSVPFALVDPQHLQFVAPAHASGSVRIAVTSGDGFQDFMDAAFTYSSTPAAQTATTQMAKPAKGIRLRNVVLAPRRIQPQTGLSRTH